MIQLIGFDQVFQSTPDLINRENTVQMAWCTTRSRFQSTPDLINRENGDAVPFDQHHWCVSIHSRFN